MKKRDLKNWIDAWRQRQIFITKEEQKIVQALEAHFELNKKREKKK